MKAKTLNDIQNKKRRRIVGLMSGTSCDGIDAALVEVEGSGEKTRIQCLAFENYKYDPVVREKIFELFHPRTSTVDKICHMNFYLGELFAEAALRIIEKAGLTPEDVDAVGSHGQTIYHMPNPVDDGGYKIRSTLQIGESAVIAQRTGLITVSDFRARDMACGGQGAPLVAYADYVLFGASSNRTRLIQNIGGIANLTLVGGCVRFEDIIAFDTGPGNMLIDGIVSIATGGQLNFDVDGRLAAAGRVSDTLLERLMRHPFISRHPPKTTGREEFGIDFAQKVFHEGKVIGLSDEDLVATVTAFTAESIVSNYEKFIFPRYRVDEVILGGGGSYNPSLTTMLRKRLAPIPVLTHEDFGISSDAKEAIAFAILANETLCGLPSNVPSATGARDRVILGKIDL